LPLLLMMLLMMLMLLPAAAGALTTPANPDGTRRIEGRVEAGSTDNSLTVQVDSRARPGVGPMAVRLTSDLPQRISNLRIQSLEPAPVQPSRESVGDRFLILFDVAPFAVDSTAGIDHTELRFAVVALADEDARFDAGEIMLSLVIEAPAPALPPASSLQPVAAPPGWDDAIARGRRESETNTAVASVPPVEQRPRSVPPRPPPPPIPDIAGQAGGVAERARQDKVRDRERAREVADVLTGVVDTLTNPTAGGQPPVYAPVLPANQIPGQPASPSARPPVAGAPPTGVPEGRGTPIPASSSCVVFDQLNYGDDAHFLVKVSSGRSGDATAFYAVSVPSQKSFGDGTSCNSGRACLDLYLRSAAPGQQTLILGSYHSRSAAIRAARQACPKPIRG
jgi:hypothetical protein